MKRTLRRASLVLMVILGLGLFGTSPVSAQLPLLPPLLGPPPEQQPPPQQQPPPPPPQEQPPPQQQPPPPPPPEQKPSQPPLPANSGAGRRVVYSNSQQRVWLVEADGNVSRTYLVSGRRGTPRAGSYEVFSRSRWASNGSARMEYMVRFAKTSGLAIGFHKIPVNSRGKPLQSESELGQYRSKGCVRQAGADAAHLWNWAPMGTRVVVTR